MNLVSISIPYSCQKSFCNPQNMPSCHHNATVGTPWLTTIWLVKSHRYNQTCPYVQLPVRMLTAAVRKCGPWWQKLQHSAGDDEMINTACLLGWIVVTFSEPCQCWQLYSWQSHIFLLKLIKCPLLFLKPAQFIQGPYYTWWQLLAAGHCYCAVCVCGELAEYNRWADRKWQLTVQNINMQWLTCSCRHTIHFCGHISTDSAHQAT